MILSGVLSTMNVWADKWDDVRLSMNDAYMILLMTGWMFLFMGLYHRDRAVIGLATVVVIVMLWCIRTQFMVTTEQYRLGMIPHHSMAVLMSKRWMEHHSHKSSPEWEEFISHIIRTQEKEIEWMKTA
jgi:hypothetical protein